jgi:PAS domain S-box-containing protein
MDRISKKQKSLVKTFSEIYQYSDDVYWLAYPDFKQTSFISPVIERWGYSRQKMLTNIKYWDSCIFPADLKSYHPFIEMIKKIKQEGPSARYDETYRVIRPDGGLRWLLDRGQPLYDSEGEYVGITGVAIDVTVIKTYGQVPIKPSSVFPESNARSRYYLRGRYRNIYLTPSEAKCAFFLMQGKTAKQTAKLLTLSPRTIEEILSNMKRKFEVKYRSDLCGALIDSDFIGCLEAE